MNENKNTIGMNELVDYQKKPYGRFMDRVMKFLWKCGGADAQILQYAPYSDHIKAAGIGGVVLATTVMATLAMGFAMHTIFGENDKYGHHGNWFVTIPVALIWGLIIFNLDRFIVSTVKGDGTEAITWGEWKSMLPRLFMAILIGLTISAPLETYIFSKEITREWNQVKTQLSLKARFDLNNEMNNDGDMANLINLAKSDSAAYYGAWKQLDSIEKYQQLVQKCDADPCPNHQKTIDSRKKVEKIMIASQKSYIQDTMKLSQYKKTRTKRLQYLSDSVKNMEPGFLDQIMMLERLSGEGKKITKYDPQTGEKVLKENGEPDEEEIYGSAFWPIWLVRLLFMIVEIAPVIFKFMIWKSSYDYMQDNVSQILEAKQGISIELIPDENNNLHKIKENYNARRIVEVAKRQNELEKENAIHAITLYAEKEREEIEANPEGFIQQVDNSNKNS
jgi:uncharacterized membrane protein